MPELTETHEFVVEGTPEILVRNRAGSITVERGTDGQVVVRVTKRARGHLLDLATEGDLARLTINVTQHGNAIRVETDPHEVGGFLKNYQVDIAIVAPAETTLELRMNAGNVDVRNLTGFIECVVNAGNFDAYGVTLTGRSSFKVNAGNLTLDSAIVPGAALDAEVNAGNLRLRLPHDTPAYLEARADVGSIDVEDWPVTVSRRIVQQQAGGPLGQSPRGTLRLRVNSGSISVRAR